MMNPKPSRRRFLHLAAGAASLPSLSRIAAAQAYPSRQINIIVPVPPGGLVDLVARALGERLAEIWGQTVIVENKAGGNFQIATAYVAKAAPDGHTLLLAMDAPFVINPHLYTKLSYDPIADFAPITSLVRFDLVLAAHPSLSVDSVRDLIALAKKKPGELNYATFGLGSTANLYMKMFESMAGVELSPVHYKGVAPMITDVVAGHVPMMFVTVGQTLPLWKEGKLKVLGVGARERVASFPDAPTFSESGLPGLEANAWFGLYAPKGTAGDMVGKINAETRRIVATPGFREKVLAQYFGEPLVSSPEEFARFIQLEYGKWGKVIRAANIKIE
jgi:tripartite-type tricarboxylate transporter receptor subunit TctC